MNCLLKNSGSHKGQGKSVHWKQKFWSPACCCKFITRKPKTQRIRRQWCPAKQCVRTKTPTKAQPAVMQDGCGSGSAWRASEKDTSSLVHEMVEGTILNAEVWDLSVFQLLRTIYCQSCGV